MNIPLRAIAVIAGLSLLASFAAAQPIPVYAEGGYANAHSVVAGGTIAFHISTSNSPFSVQIVNMANASTVLTTISSLTSTVRDCTGMWENGCAWPVTTQFTVPSNWTPGYYAAKFPTSRGTRNILFVVRSATPGSYSPIVVVQPTNTYVAYNTYTGKCVYDSLSTNNQRAKIVSLDRPYEEDAGLSRYRTWEQPFVDWMKSEGRSFEVITDDDLDAGLSLSAYKAVLLVGHSEYWTLAAREYLEAFHAAGGHIAVFAGNSIWWQARLDPQNRQMTVYKSASLDPKRGVDDDVVTVNWFDWPVLHPENLLLGASFRNAGYANRTANGFDGLPTNQRTPYTVTNASSWVFDQTGVTNGSLIAQASAGIETDGALFNTMPDGTLAVEGSDGTPLSYDILATLPASDGYATIGLVTNPQGGAVFNTGTRDWTRGLATDAVVQQMTRNVLDRFATGAPFAYAPRVTPNRVEDRFNTPMPPSEVIPGWTREPMNVTLSSRCAHDGPTGLDLSGTSWTQLVRSFAVNHTGMSAAQFNVWVNESFLQATPAWAIPILGLRDIQGTEEAHVVTLETQIRSGGARSIRVSAFRADGSTTATTPWVVLTPGWHSVTVAWASPGEVSMNVSGQKVTAFNPESGQTANALMAEFAGSGVGATGAICIDELQLRDAFAPAVASMTELAASPESIVANGTSTSTITVQLKDADGNAIVNGGDTVTLATTRGTLSSVTDLGDGRYRATLTSSTSAGDATITANVNGNPATNNATVAFIGGPAVSLTINAPASAPANTPFEITVTARDAHGNIAESYEGTVHFTSSDAQATLPSNAAFDNDDHGVKTFSVTLRGAGTHSITVTDVANATITGSANVAVQGGMLPPPASIDAVATSTTSASIVWSPVANASSYVVERSFNGGAFIPILTTSMTSHQDNGLASATSYLYRVHALDATNTPGANSAIDVASTIALTDDPSGRIRAADFHDLRTAIDALRRTAGLANATYTNAIVAGAPVRAVDLTEMRNALNGGRSAAGMSAYAFAESIVAGVTTIKHAHLDELRSALGTVGSN